MDKSIFKPTPLSVIRSCAASVLFTAAVIFIVWLGLNQAEESNRSEALRTLRESILRASVKCYATEGRYPESIAYLEENYDIHVDESKFVVHYVPFASNILPDISVTELQSQVATGGGI